MATKKNTEAVAKPKAKVTEMKHRGTAKGSKPASAERAKARHPFPDEQSMVAGAFELTQRPDGVTIKALKTFIEKHKTGKTAFWVISAIRKGEKGGFKWKVEEEDGIIRTGRPKQIAA